MNYNEAYTLKKGDKVVINDTDEEHNVESIRGTTSYIFVILDNGRSYRHDLVGLKN